MSGKEWDDFIPWYKHDTAGWLRLSLAARGAMAEIARKLNRKGELRLSGGLPDLAFLLRLEWDSELAPAVAELVAAGRIEWDGSRFLLRDPEFEVRKRKGSAERMADKRARERATSVNGGSRSDACDVTRVTDPHVTGVTPVLSDLSPLSDLRISSREGVQGEPSTPESPDSPPDWWETALGVVAMNAEPIMNPGAAWLRYRGHRAGKRLPLTQRDAEYWLTSVVVAEQAMDRQRARERGDARAGSRDPPKPEKSPEQRRREAEFIAASVAGRKVGT